MKRLNKEDREQLSVLLGATTLFAISAAISYLLSQTSSSRFELITAVTGFLGYSGLVLITLICTLHGLIYLWEKTLT